MIGSFLCGYRGSDGESGGSVKKNGEKLGFFRFISKKFMLRQRFVTPVKRFFIRSFEKSAVLSFIRRVLGEMLTLPIRTYGIFLFSFGLFALVVYLIRQFALKYGESSLSSLIFGLALMFLSLLMFSVKETLSSALCGSLFMNALLFKVMGVRREYIETSCVKEGSSVVPFIIGMLFGLSTYYISPVYLFLGIAALIALYTLLMIPEFGVMLMFLTLPFLPTMALVGLCSYTLVCYLLKLICGKRTLRFESVDLLVFVFAALYMLGGIVSVAGAVSLKHSLVFVCFISGYFLTVNLIRTGEWVGRCVGSIAISSLFVALYGVYEYFTGVSATTWQDTEMFEDISGRVVSTFENPNVLAEYLLMAAPFALALLLTSKKPAEGTIRLGVLGCLCLCMVFTWSRGAWLGMLFSALLFLLIASRKSMLLIFAGIAALPFMPFILPQSIISRFTSIGNLADTSTSYRVNIWKAVIKIARDYFFTGVGTGNAAFGTVYPLYSLAGIESAPHSHQLYLQILVELGIFGLAAFLCAMLVWMRANFTFYAQMGGESPRKLYVARLYSAAGFCGIVGVLVQGMTDYVWYNYRVVLMFWLVCGLTMAVRRVSIRENPARDKVKPIGDYQPDSACIDIKIDE